jgi:GWxTD domain-containing protein
VIRGADRIAVQKGRLPGGPFAWLAGTLLAAACGGGSTETPTPRADAVVARPLETYRQLGLVAGPPEFPAVVDFTTVAGPFDSTYVLLAMSLPNSALRFQRDATGFIASYQVAAEFRQGTATARRFGRTEAVHVPNFAEAGRTDESVVFQQAVLLAPGRYEIFLHASAEGTTRSFETIDTLDVPRYGESGAAMAGPIVIYQGTGRATREALPELILNPRHTVAYGGEEPKLFVEWYGAGAPVPITMRILDERDELVRTVEGEVPAGEAEVRFTQLALPVESLPLGKLWIQLVAPGVLTPNRTPLVISISDQWMVANYEEVLQFLRYIATSAEIDELGAGTPQERRERWETFWRKRDPILATPTNEYRDEFFQRVRFASEQFGEPGGSPGWRTHRGEVYIVLGPPDFEQDRYIGRTDVAQANGIEWLYESLPGGRVSLLFFDRTGFGRFELTPSSEAAFRSMADRMKPRSN